MKLISLVFFGFVFSISAEAGISCFEPNPGNPELTSVNIKIAEAEPGRFTYWLVEEYKQYPGTPITTQYNGLWCQVTLADQGARGTCQWGFPNNTVLEFIHGNTPSTTAILSRRNNEMIAVGKTFTCKAE